MFFYTTDVILPAFFTLFIHILQSVNKQAESVRDYKKYLSSEPVPLDYTEVYTEMTDYVAAKKAEMYNQTGRYIYEFLFVFCVSCFLFCCEKVMQCEGWRMLCVFGMDEYAHNLLITMCAHNLFLFLLNLTFVTGSAGPAGSARSAYGAPPNATPAPGELKCLLFIDYVNFLEYNYVGSQPKRAHFHYFICFSHMAYLCSFIGPQRSSWHQQQWCGWPPWLCQ